VLDIDLNKHAPAHLYRAAQEGIAYSFRYGLDIMRENNIEPKLIRAGKANMFLSDVFIDAFVNITNVPVELYENDGSVGAALGAALVQRSLMMKSGIQKYEAVEVDRAKRKHDMIRAMKSGSTR
jgi:sugar (pentulose or hexulose) kinase